MHRNLCGPGPRAGPASNSSPHHSPPHQPPLSLLQRALHNRHKINDINAASVAPLPRDFENDETTDKISMKFCLQRQQSINILVDQIRATIAALLPSIACNKQQPWRPRNVLVMAGEDLYELCNLRFVRCPITSSRVV